MTKEEKAAYDKKYRAANKHKIADYEKHRQKKNKDKKASYLKEYENANKEQLVNYRKAYYQANKQKIAEQRKEYRQANKDKLAAYFKKRRKDNPEINKIARHKRRALKKQCGGAISKGITEKLMTLQRAKCAICKTSVKTGHHLDHIMPLALGGSNTDDNIQILCPDCNRSKGAKHPQDFMMSLGFLL